MFFILIQILVKCILIKNGLLLNLVLSVSANQFTEILTLLLRVILVILNMNLMRSLWLFIIFIGQLTRFFRFWRLFTVISWTLLRCTWWFPCTFQLLVLLYTSFQLTLPWSLQLLDSRLKLLQIRVDSLFDYHILDLMNFRSGSKHSWNLIRLFQLFDEQFLHFILSQLSFFLDLWNIQFIFKLIYHFFDWIMFLQYFGHLIRPGWFVDYIW